DGKLRELHSRLWFRSRVGDGPGAVHALSRFRTARNRSRAGMERGPARGLAHAIVAAHAFQPAAYHPRPHRMGPAGTAVDGGPARRPAASTVERGRARLQPVGG